MDFSDAVILCVGDVMLDRFMHGDIERISPEAPIPVIRLTRTDEMLGGAGNVANNVAALGGRALLVGLVGQDGWADAVTRLAGAVAGIEQHLVPSQHRPTICKTRFVAAQQQVVRADEESRLPLQPDEEASLAAAVAGLIGRASAVILSDYGKGVLSPRIVSDTVKAARQAGIPVFVDPKSDDFSRYAGATCITPNLKELARAGGMEVAGDAQVEAAARHVMAAAGAAAILATRSAEGMMLVEAEGSAHAVAALAREVFDVSGAGDTVIAAMALAHASGLSLLQSMHVANAAAGVVVSKLGTATASVHEVLAELENQERAGGGELPGVRTLAGAEARVLRWKEQGLRVGFTNGCFDIVHPGHVSLLKAARAQCDRLVVALNTDESVSRLKGPSRPVNDLQHRAQVIAAIGYVDLVVAFDEPTPIGLITRLLPDVLIKGADYTVEQVVGHEVVQAAGGRVYLAPLVPGRSTTSIIARMRDELAGNAA